MAYENFRQKIVNLQADVSLFKVEFVDRDGFKQFANQLYSKVGDYPEICITGYFSETIREQLDRITNYVRTRGFGEVRLICPYFPIKGKRDRNNLQSLRRINEAGAKVKVNDRLHARFLVAYAQSENSELIGGLLILGSFDFNTECIGRERYDAGIMTKHPDLVNSAIRLFDQIWNDNQSKDLLKKYEKELMN